MMIALATCLAVQHADPDLALLLAEMDDAEVVAWDDPTVEWSRFDKVIIRSTWNAHLDRDRFVAWCRQVDRVSELWNPPDLVEWNTDKRYLLDLAAHGIPIVPTRFVAPGEHLDDRCDGVDIDLGGDVVVKPTVAAGSYGIGRFQDDRDGIIGRVDEIHRQGLTAMIQAYQSQIDTQAETGLVYFGGQYSHCFAKSAILASEITTDEAGLYAVEQIEPRQPTRVQREIADRVVDAIPETAYLRIDLVPTDQGPAVLEVEATEPSLFIDTDDQAAARAARIWRTLARL